MNPLARIAIYRMRPINAQARKGVTNTQSTRKTKSKKKRKQPRRKGTASRHWGKHGHVMRLKASPSRPYGLGSTVKQHLAKPYKALDPDAPLRLQDLLRDLLD
jgi:hypothetical protein